MSKKHLNVQHRLEGYEFKVWNLNIEFLNSTLLLNQVGKNFLKNEIDNFWNCATCSSLYIWSSHYELHICTLYIVLSIHDIDLYEYHFLM